MSEKYQDIPLIGCDNAINAILTALNGSKLSHAYLLEGAHGCGKYTFALYMSAHILSHGLTGAERERQYKRTLEGSHTDLSVLSPESEGVRGFKVDAIRRLSQDIHIFPYEGERKVYILRECQRMNDSAQNAFLKSLEEPPSFAVFFLLSSGPGLLSTIRSRCVSISMPALDEEDVKKVVEKTYPNMDRERLTACARLSRGSAGAALEFASGKDWETWRTLSLDFLNTLSSEGKNSASLLLLAKKYKRMELIDLLEQLMLGVRDIITAKAYGGAYSPAFFTDNEVLSALCSSFSAAKLTAIYSAAGQAREELYVYNANPDACVSAFLARCFAGESD